VLDFGLWGKDERSSLRQAAVDRGAEAVMLFCDVGLDEQRRRLGRRLAEEPHTTWPISEAELASWADVFQRPTPEEVDGSEPIPAPPADFADWDAWRADRWPSAID